MELLTEPEVRETLEEMRRDLAGIRESSPPDEARKVLRFCAIDDLTRLICLAETCLAAMATLCLGAKCGVTEMLRRRLTEQTARANAAEEALSGHLAGQKIRAHFEIGTREDDDKAQQRPPDIHLTSPTGKKYKLKTAHVEGAEGG